MAWDESQEANILASAEADRMRAVIADVAEVCRRHGVKLEAICKSEGIEGEIVILDASEPDSNWSGPRNKLRADNLLLYVGVIG